jgi:hypothetical protein
MKQSKSSLLTCEIMYAMLMQIMTMRMGIFLGNLFWGCANMHVAQTVLAVGQQWVAN